MARVTRERINRGWYLLHAGSETYEANAEGPGGMWRVCPYGHSELEELRPTLRDCEKLVEYRVFVQPDD